MAQHPHAGGLGTLLWYYQYTDSRVTISPTVEFTFNAHEDIMGSASYYTKQTGAVYEEHIYDAWGGVRWSTGHGVNDGKTLVIEPNYTGHSYDPILKIYHAEARFYDAKTRQWMASDPIKSGLNWYQYVASNPTNYVDPTGLIAVIGEDENGNLIFDTSTGRKQMEVQETKNWLQREIQKKDKLIAASSDSKTVSKLQQERDTQTQQLSQFGKMKMLNDKVNHARGIKNYGYFAVMSCTNSYTNILGYRANLIVSQSFGEWFESIDPKTGKVTSGYHLGTDYIGNAIISDIFGGTVSYVHKQSKSPYSSWGNYVITTQDFGDFSVNTIYGHLTDDSIVVKPGEKITSGNVLGIMGKTGNSYGVHLHLQIFITTGTSTNTPSAYLDKPTDNPAYRSKEFGGGEIIYIDPEAVFTTNGKIIYDIMEGFKK